jgi:sigma-B regulation protein RsbU (phosphoserine phosphatase)
MSGPTPTPKATAAHRARRRSVQDFWHRVSEGQQLDELWNRFMSEASSSARLYQREVAPRFEDAPAGRRKERWKAFLWAFLEKLSPARRVALVLAAIMMVIGPISFRYKQASFDFGIFQLASALLLLLLLALEVADRVAMKRDLEIAREIQGWLLPADAPRVPGLDVAFATRPANTVAGDYYDVFERRTAEGGRRLLIVVADVCGKSIPAALLMATFQASLRTLAATGADLAHLAAGLNRYACTHSQEGRRFTTAFVAEIDPDGGAMTYVNAGQDAPMLRRANGDIERLDSTGIPFGILPDAHHEMSARTLGEGDQLLIYTDGLPEAMNVRQKEFGESGIRESWSQARDAGAEQTVRTLIESVNRFVGDAPAHDDITCLLVQRHAAHP